MLTVPFISICIPAFSQPDSIRRLLGSIEKQTFRNFEVIITDDSPGDEVSRAVESFRDDLSILYEKNRSQLGSPANWNKAVSLAKGKWVKIMHHDDWFFDEGSLQLFAGAADEKADPSLIFCNTAIVDSRNATEKFHVPPAEQLAALKSSPSVLFNYNFIGAPSAAMFRNTGHRFNERLKYLVDVEFYIRLLRQNNSFVHVDRFLIKNTAGDERQVTAQSMNRQTQVGEYSYLYREVYGRAMPSIAISGFFIYLFRRYQLRSLNEIEDFGFPAPRPRWYFLVLLWLSKLKNN
jgi:glycosyltransferase involved in cell wall biosynthesis